MSRVVYKSAIRILRENAKLGTLFLNKWLDFDSMHLGLSVWIDLLETFALWHLYACSIIGADIPRFRSRAVVWHLLLVLCWRSSCFQCRVALWSFELKTVMPSWRKSCWLRTVLGRNNYEASVPEKAMYSYYFVLCQALVIEFETIEIDVII